MPNEFPRTENPEHPELFFGTVGAIGTDLGLVSELLAECLDEVRYKLQTIKLSSLLEKLEILGAIPQRPLEARYNALMDAGDKLRSDMGRGDALAVLAVRYVREELRQPLSGSPARPADKAAYMFQGLKHTEEVRALRDIYQSGFFLIGAYAPHELRRTRLARGIAKSYFSRSKRQHLEKADELIERDEREESNRTFGQDVENTFPLADLFVDVSRPRDEIKAAIQRFIAILFGYPYHTPTREEYAMFHAYSAALRSSALGRQVGAAIATPDGEIIALGTNEVPRPGGGTFWTGDSPDARDFQLGYDSSDEIRQRNLGEILQKLKESGWLATDKAESDLEIMLREAIPMMRGTRVMVPIEFGRAVHAEMCAFMDAARRGVQVRGCTLYTSTYPCHNCAMHIVAAGIKKVVFIEPYPKSLATELFSDLIGSGETAAAEGKVVFDAFVGIAPVRYLFAFTMRTRKTESGSVVDWKKSDARPLIAAPYLTYFEEEDSKGRDFAVLSTQFELSLYQEE